MPQVNVDWKLVVAGAGVFVVLYFLAKREVGSAVAAVGGAIDPTSKNNIAAKGTNALTKAVTMRENDTMGFAVWRLFHKDEAAALDQHLKK